MKNRLLFNVGCLLLIFVANSGYSKEITTNTAIMQAMDKITGRVNKISVPVNSKVSFGDFSVVLRSCKKTPAEETPENFAFVDVADKSFGKDEYNIFRGWLISSTPGINAIEHPIYDVWLLECVDTDIKDAILLTKEELDERNSLPSKKVITEKNLNNDKDISKTENKKTIHIKEFINEDIDIEKNIITPETIEDTIDDASESPQNLLNFTKDAKILEDNNSSEDSHYNDELSNAIDEEIKLLKQ